MCIHQEDYLEAHLPGVVSSFIYGLGKIFGRTRDRLESVHVLQYGRKTVYAENTWKCVGFRFIISKDCIRKNSCVTKISVI